MNTFTLILNAAEARIQLILAREGALVCAEEWSAPSQGTELLTPVLADTLSTALFVAGPEAALDFWRGRDDFELVLCTDDNHIIVTQGLEDVFQLYDQDGGYTYEIARR